MRTAGRSPTRPTRCRRSRRWWRPSAASRRPRPPRLPETAVWSGRAPRGGYNPPRPTEPLSMTGPALRRAALLLLGLPIPASAEPPAPPRLPRDHLLVYRGDNGKPHAVTTVE